MILHPNAKPSLGHPNDLGTALAGDDVATGGLAHAYKLDPVFERNDAVGIERLAGLIVSALLAFCFAFGAKRL